MLLELYTAFVDELRAAGIPVSMVESIDALTALERIELSDRALVKNSMAATLVKNARHQAAFETVFDVFFAPIRPEDEGEEERSAGDGPDEGGPDDGGPDEGSGAGPGGGFRDRLLEALRNNDLTALRELARAAVGELAGMERGRPVGGTYYLYRTMRQLDLDAVMEQLLTELETPAGLEHRMWDDEIKARVEAFRAEVQDEIRARLVADRGPEAVARTLREPLLEDTDLMHANRTELQAISDAVLPLARRLVARLALKRRRRHEGRLDFRKTVRRSLGTGGVPLDPQFKAPHPSKPEVFLLCDISGSMSTFARFTLQFVYAMASQFSRLRAFAFIDHLDEVTAYLGVGANFETAVNSITREAGVVWLDGHSDYGHALTAFRESYLHDITPRTTVIIAGDARSNYRPAGGEIVAEIEERARAVYWLNPEPPAYWNTGDSVMRAYQPFCTAVFEVRNLRQLEHFIEKLADTNKGKQPAGR